MAYDYAGGWLSKLEHHANVYPRKDAAVPEFSTQQGIESLRSFGVDPSKMVLGLPAYAKVFRNLAQLGDPMTRDSDVGPQSIRSLMKEPGWVIICDEHLVACQGINQETHRFATLDTAETIAAKADYAKAMGFAGTLWALDHLPGKDGLYIAAAKAFGRLERSPSLQYYPDSCFANVRGEAERRKPVSTSVSSLAAGPIDTGLPTPAASAESTSVRQWRNGTSSVRFSTSAPAAVSGQGRADRSRRRLHFLRLADGQYPVRRLRRLGLHDAGHRRRRHGRQGGLRRPGHRRDRRLPRQGRLRPGLARLPHQGRLRHRLSARRRAVGDGERDARRRRRAHPRASGRPRLRVRD